MKSYLAKGIRYERKVVKWYKSACPKRANVLADQWFEFEDQEGYGCAQVDLLHVLDDRVLVFEIKYGAFERVGDELSNLYIPLASSYFDRPCIAIHIFQNTKPYVNEYPGVRSTSDLSKAQPGKIYHWHLIL